MIRQDSVMTKVQESVISTIKKPTGKRPLSAPPNLKKKAISKKAITTTASKVRLFQINIQTLLYFKLSI